MKKHLPNFLTLGRLVLVPPIILFLFFPGKVASATAGLLFFVASLTDFFDGFIARRFSLESSFGRFLDPIADKVLVTSALVMLIALDRVPAWIVMLIITREVAVSALRAITKSWDTTLQPSPVGKLKAVFQFAAIVPLIIHYDYTFFFVTVNFHFIGTVLLYIALFLTIWSGMDYFLRFYREYEGRENGDAF
ncbi:CDP-diacylglycerol--glycerol-3-phosphate 3-phosphatidyltransferase [Desulfomonile tiedjei]|uniref:CDP-diacylglycerol--glycerol-3-phosphate 3-phosphatidyltransferase n=1 Tax=Desulfomonile tiedjei (strain ATCC 49306 / DSM 6799 / DCB-1) TaxID=706587 RepID=I4C841_DESTA|nr:CDP-diacylglycerol--glycerol-3-phosphate 3-phosphatidyltransferase [Desulfomonile tiedjei]AFM25732.1 CDP-diacylglycerol--glycerol-3-phosphate 3-phosphatidyltransferase [Desulfomonile tiedjei DSM 6799]